jgi:uncharacterized membrane protein YagU involved in acid resistance
MNDEKRSLVKAAASGAAGGLAGSAAKVMAESFAPPRPTGDGGTNRDVHWSAGIVLGVLYGVLAEYFPKVTSRDGADFGVALWAFARRIAAPAAPVAAPPVRLSLFERGSDLSSSAIYGLVTELGRKSMRSLLD